jgi:hypothetical protein
VRASSDQNLDVVVRQTVSDKHHRIGPPQCALRLVPNLTVMRITVCHGRPLNTSPLTIDFGQVLIMEDLMLLIYLIGCLCDHLSGPVVD